MIRIILLEDHAIVREGIRFLLEQEMDISVVAEFEHPQDLFAALPALNADLLITDLDFKQFRGLDILLDSVAITTLIRTIVLSMHGEAGMARRAMDLGAFGYVSKSRSARELVTAIQAVHQGHFYLSEDIRDQVVITPPHITKREHEVLRLLRAGKTAKVIGNELGISDKTVYIHRASLMEKFKCKTLIELSQKAHELGI